MNVRPLIHTARMFNATLDLFPTETPETGSSEATSDRAPALTNEVIARGLDELATLVAGRREALRHAAASVRFSARPVTERVAESGVEGVHELGIDYELAGLITDWVRSGKLRWLEQARSRQFRELEKLPGIGPRLARELRDVLGIVDLDGLLGAARDGRLGHVYGFGPKRVNMVMQVLGSRVRSAA